MALTKSGDVSLQGIASVAASTVNLSSAVDVSSYYASKVGIVFGRGTGTAFTTSPAIRVEGSRKTTGTVSSTDETDWFTLASFTPAIGASIGSQAVSGTVASGSGTLPLAAATNFAAGDYLFIQNTTLANSEWKHTQSLATATFTLQDNLTNAQTGSTARNQAEHYLADLDLTEINSLRLVVDNSQGGQAFIVKASFGAVSAL